MTKEKLLFLLRIALGWIFLYSGVSKLMAGNWTAAGYLKTAQTLPGLFSFFASPENIGLINALNMWGQTLIGVSLILGVFLPIVAIFGPMLMLLYYLPILHFPYVGKTALLIDDHVMYTLVMLVLWKLESGNYWGLRKQLKKLLPKTLTRFV